MDPEEFREECLDMVESIQSEVVSYPILKCGQKYFGNVVHNFICVVVDYDFDPVLLGVTQLTQGKWALILNTNVCDLYVPGCGPNTVGVVVGRHSTYSNYKTTTQDQLDLVYTTYPSKGLSRSRTPHEG